MTDDLGLEVDPAQARLHVLAIAKALDAFDSSNAIDRQTQAGLGWLRAMVDQARLIVSAQDAGRSHAAAPNRRLFLELGLAIGWLNLDGILTVEAMLRRAEYDISQFLKRQKGEWADGARAEHEEIKKRLPMDGDRSRDNRGHILAMSQAVAGGEDIYFAWWDETQYSHSSLTLALAYAPDDVAGTLGRGTPPGSDTSVLMVLQLLLALSYVSKMISDEGHPEVGQRLFSLWFETNPAG